LIKGIGSLVYNVDQLHQRATLIRRQGCLINGAQYRTSFRLIKVSCQQTKEVGFHQGRSRGVLVNWKAVLFQNNRALISLIIKPCAHGAF
jgi:hypothetical protein